MEWCWETCHRESLCRAQNKDPRMQRPHLSPVWLSIQSPVDKHCELPFFFIMCYYYYYFYYCCYWQYFIKYLVPTRRYSMYSMCTLTELLWSPRKLRHREVKSLDPSYLTSKRRARILTQACWHLHAAGMLVSHLEAAEGGWTTLWVVSRSRLRTFPHLYQGEDSGF